jgi:hypothetical protein
MGPIHDEVLRQCDMLDGVLSIAKIFKSKVTNHAYYQVADGIINNPLLCR